MEEMMESGAEAQPDKNKKARKADAGLDQHRMKKARKADAGLDQHRMKAHLEAQIESGDVVQVHLPQRPEQETQLPDEFVQINGHVYLTPHWEQSPNGKRRQKTLEGQPVFRGIPRGEAVMVPRLVYEVLEQSGRLNTL